MSFRLSIIIAFSSLLLSCNQQVDKVKEKTSEIGLDPANIEEASAIQIISGFQGVWHHEKDQSAIIKVVGKRWIDLYQDGATNESDSFKIDIVHKLPQYVDTIVQADFIKLTNNSDTIYYEILGLSDSLFSLMHYPTGRKHLYKKLASTYLQELQQAMADPAVDQYFKDIVTQEKLIHADDNKMLSVPENISSANPDKHFFYFMVFTKSMNGSDGFYSEAIGLAAYEYVTTNTEQFAEYFNNAPNLTDKDMDNWAKYIYSEIQISASDSESKALAALEVRLLNNVNNSKKEHKLAIETLLEKIKNNAHKNGYK